MVNYIPEPIRKSVGGFKDKVISFFKTNTPKQTMHGRGKKLNRPKTQKQYEENKINIIRNPFILKKRKKEKLIKDRIIRDIWTPFEEEEEEKERKKLEKKKKLKIE